MTHSQINQAKAWGFSPSQTNSGVSLTPKQQTLQFEDSGESPTTPHQLKLKLINKLTALQVYEWWHYLKRTPTITTLNFGVFFKNRLVGAISFGSPNATELQGFYDKNSQKGWFEIKRFALADDCPKNSESRVISVAIKLLRKRKNVKGIVTLADTEVGHLGTIYRACGFKYLGLTAPKKDFYVFGRIKQRGKTKGIRGEWKDRSRKHLFIKNFP